MTKQIIICCDNCGVRGAETLSITVGRETDAAGSGDDVWQGIDLCPNCLRYAVVELVQARSYPERRAWLKDHRKATGSR